MSSTFVNFMHVLKALCLLKSGKAYQVVWMDIIPHFSVPNFNRHDHPSQPAIKC